MQNITYTLCGDYYLPDIVLSEPPQEQTEPLTKYGIMRRAYLREHRPITYSRLLLTERLYPHLREVQRIAAERVESLMEQLAERNPPPDKAADNIAWAAHMNMLKHTAEEMALGELIYG